MNRLKNQFDLFIRFIYSIKDKNLDWQSANQGRLLELFHQRAVAKKSLEAELAKRNAQLAHEIDLLKTRQNAELAMLKTRCNQDINDYRHYLESLNKLKQTIQGSYSHLPEAIALTIHHHAKSLLNQMWESDNLADKIKYETQLIKFMTTLHEEAHEFKAGALVEKLPENTLNLINQEYNNKPFN